MNVLPRIFLGLVLLADFSAQVNGGTLCHLSGGRSPDGKQEVVLFEADSKELSYVLLSRGGRSPKLSIPSSYQPGKGESPKWASQQACEARVFWNRESKLFAIEEATHHGSGMVRLARVEPGAPSKELSLPAPRTFQPSGIDWTKSRLFCPGGFIASDTLELEARGEKADGVTQVVLARVRIKSNGQVVVESVRQERL